MDRKRRKSFAVQKILQILAISASRQWRGLHYTWIIHVKSELTELLTMQPGSYTYCTFIRPLKIPIHLASLQQPTHHAKSCPKKNLYPSPRSLNRTKTKVSASHGPRKKRIWMPSRLSLRIWKLRCEKRELHLWNVALGWRKVWKTHYLLTIVRKIAWCEFVIISFF